MINIKNILTGRSMALTNVYRGLKTTTSIEAGFETMSVQIDGQYLYAGNAETVWNGQEIEYLSVDGTVWRGIIDQVQQAEGYWNIFAVGFTLYELALQPVYGVYYDRLVSGFKDIKTDGISGKADEDIGIYLDVAGDKLVTDASRGGLEWNSPFAGGSFGDLRWVEITYRRIGTPVIDVGAYSFDVYGVDGVTETLLTSVAATSVDFTDQIFTWTGTGIQRLRLVLVKTGGDGTSSDPDMTLVHIKKVEVSLLDERPTISNVIEHLFSRNIETKVTVRSTPGGDVIAPVVPTGTQSSGQEALIELQRQAKATTGDQWFFGTWGTEFSAYTLTGTRWRITARDAGAETVFNQERGAPAVGGTATGVITDVTAHYTDAEGVGRFTNWVSTGLRLPRTRLEIIEAAGEDTAEDEAEARALALSQWSPSGSFVVKEVARMERGGTRSAAIMRAFDWVTIDSLSLGPLKTETDRTRGGIIGKTSYDGDANETTVELLGDVHT